MTFTASLAMIRIEILRRVLAGRTGTIADFEFEELPDTRVRVTVIFTDKDRYVFFCQELEAAIRERLAAMQTVGAMQ